MIPHPLSVQQALDRLLAEIHPLPAEQVPLSECLGRVLAEDVVSTIDLPPHTNSAMDGYAVRAADVSPASSDRSVELEVIGEVRAGEVPACAVGPGQAMRIMTGAPVPPGADAVVPIEFTLDPGDMVGSRLPEKVRVSSKVAPGDHLRRAGQDVLSGTKVLARGQRLRPQDVGMLAALGVAKPNVHRAPRVALFSTGDELIEVDERLVPGTIRDSNGYALAASVEAARAIPLRLGIVSDQPEAVAGLLEQAVAQRADLIVSSAGVSVGVYDVVRPALEAHGKLGFWRVNIKPGKPLVYGTYRGVPYLGLPGNPVSAFVTFEVFARPIIDRLSGMARTEREILQVRMEDGIRLDGRETYLRSRVWFSDGEARARMTGSQDSGALSTLVKANALVVVPAGRNEVRPGEVLEAWYLGGMPDPEGGQL